ncbi:hypothetical protein ABEV55_03215 [Aneurinibacillus thermoaerophilus]|uniref:hypothetical protein n=1 Tax=Aneurinibacillus thermoaerophilus TaxID=143495 RepID=UPI002E1E79D7|nr:hypothetical protein [Aneurinibacillus thermoaerophilus]
MIQNKRILLESSTQTNMTITDIKAYNDTIYKETGIVDCFTSVDDFIEHDKFANEELLQGGREFGDYQTPPHLTHQICEYLVRNYNCNPTIVIEPTFGKGNFINSVLDFFSNIKKIYGVEIQKGYVWYCKKTLLEKQKFSNQKPDIYLYHDDIFSHDFDKSIFNSNEEVLIIGNPPWVTNSELGTLDAKNLPNKNNFKKHKGLDALTGKSNFDICEYTILRMLETFSNVNGTLAMLCKNSVAKKIVHDLPKRRFNITDIKLLNIDAKKDFNAATEASLFVVRLGKPLTDQVCKTYKLDEPEKLISTFGWYNHKFVSNIDKYKRSYLVDNQCQFEWRSGIKHDCSSVMELDTKGNKLTNKLKEIVDIERDLVYDLLKSSDLKAGIFSDSVRKKVIITQKNIGESTDYIEKQYPKLWSYLQSHKDKLDARKSSIYKGKPSFSIFGIGDYSFLPYKVAISGMYKNSHFTFIQPINNKPVMLDDTCYFLSFNDYNTAIFTFAVLNSEVVKDFLSGVVFLDEKRPYTKDLLMRIDLYRATEQITFDDILLTLKPFSDKINLHNISSEAYQDYIDLLKNKALLL